MLLCPCPERTLARVHLPVRGPVPLACRALLAELNGQTHTEAQQSTQHRERYHPRPIPPSQGHGGREAGSGPRTGGA